MSAFCGESPAVEPVHHHIAGDLTLAYEGLEMAAVPGLTLTLF
ncbi:hypothetical protein [Streptomyces alfalfae]